MAATHRIGIDLGETKILAGLFDNKQDMVARQKLPTNSQEGVPADEVTIDLGTNPVLTLFQSPLMNRAHADCHD